MQEVEHLRAKLQPQWLAKREVAQHGNVPRRQTRSNERVTAEIPVETAVVGHGQKRRRIEPFVRRPENDGAAEGRVDERSHRIARVAIIRGVVTELRSEWEPALQRDDRVQ